MNASLAAVAFTAILTATASAASIDMNAEHRSVGRENDVRIDAQLVSGTVSPGSAVGVTWQIQNFSDVTVAVATRIVDASYDQDSRTITLAIGSEVPDEGKMPQMVLVAPGEKKVFRAAATPSIAPAARTAGNAPRFVQVQVSILRDLKPFLELIQKQSTAELSDQLFEQWFESTDTIFLNTLPVQWSARGGKVVDVEQRSASF